MSDKTKYSEGEAKTRLLIADDQRLFADNLKAVIEYRTQDFEVVGIARDGGEAVEMTERLQPDMVLMDIRMPVLNGVEATKIIHQRFPEIGVVVLTTFDDDEYIAGVLEVGARGYMLKDIPFEELLATLRAARMGTFTFSPTIVSTMVKRNQGEARPGQPDSEDFQGQVRAGPLPPWIRETRKREREIMRLLMEGLDNSEIAGQLFLSEQTVKNYVYGIYTKLGEHNRIKAAEIIKTYAKYLD